jgi:hypothetical protein
MVSRRSAPLRRWVLPLAILGLLPLSGCASLGLEHVGMGVGSYTTTWALGSCHRLDQLAESDAMYASDTSPAVPCTKPHQSETFAVAPITGPLARQADRPSPVWMESALRDACDWGKMAHYLGDETPDITRDIVVLQIFPSVPEWHAGVRRVRCDALIGPRTSESVATISQSLRGIVRTPAARFRVCRLGFTEVPCDGLHTAELVYPYVKFTGKELAQNRIYKLNKVKEACQSEVAAYVGVPLASRPDLKLEPELPGDYPHADSLVGHCWVAPANEQSLSGTVRRSGAGGAA